MIVIIRLMSTKKKHNRSKHKSAQTRKQEVATLKNKFNNEMFGTSSIYHKDHTPHPDDILSAAEEIQNVRFTVEGTRAINKPELVAEISAKLKECEEKLLNLYSDQVDENDNSAFKSRAEFVL